MKFKFRLDRLDTDEYIIEAPDRMKAEVFLRHKAEEESEKLRVGECRDGYIITYLREARPDADIDFDCLSA